MVAVGTLPPAQFHAVPRLGDAAAAGFLRQGAVHVPVAALTDEFLPVFTDGQVGDGHPSQVFDGDVPLGPTHDGDVPDLGDPGRSVRVQVHRDVYVTDLLGRQRQRKYQRGQQEKKPAHRVR